MVSVYSFSASLSGLLAACFIDRFDRKSALLVLYAGFTAATLFCATAPSFGMLMLGRAAAGGCAGVMMAQVLAIIGDVLPDSRRAIGMGVIMSAFSVASILGVPAGLALANLSTWRTPFVVLSILSVGVLGMAWRVLPSLRGHLAHSWRQKVTLWEVLTRPAHVRAYVLMIVLVLSTFTIIPYMSLYLVNNLHRKQEELPYVYLCGGLATLLTMTPIGWLADRYGKLPVFRILALFTLIPILLLTHLSPMSLLVTLLVTTLFMVASAGRMVPAMALITGSTQARYRGSFMSINTSVQQLAAGLAPLLSAAILGEAKSGAPLQGFNLLGLLAMVAVICSVIVGGYLRPTTGEPAALAPAES
jgi:predicted MFS family arabinose efflux permease